MTNHIVEILEGGVPRPNPTPVEHGDTVTFHVEGTQEVSVTFNSPCCLTDSTPLTLDGSNSLTASCSPRAVSSLALKRGYTYSVEVLRASASNAQKLGGNAEAKQGELDVTTDPPKDKEKR